MIKTFLINYLLASQMLNNGVSAQLLTNSEHVVGGSPPSSTTTSCKECYESVSVLSGLDGDDCFDMCREEMAADADTEYCQRQCECAEDIDLCCHEIVQCVSDDEAVPSAPRPPSPKEEEEEEEAPRPPSPKKKEEEEEEEEAPRPPSPKKEKEEEETVVDQCYSYCKSIHEDDGDLDDNHLSASDIERLSDGKYIILETGETEDIMNKTEIVLPNNDVILIKDGEVIRVRDDRVVLDTADGEPLHITEDEFERMLINGTVIEHDESGERLKLDPTGTEIIRVRDGMAVVVSQRRDLLQVEITDEDIDQMVRGEVVEDKGIRLIDDKVVSVNDSFEAIQMTPVDMIRIHDAESDYCVEQCETCLKQCGNDKECLTKCGQDVGGGDTDVMFGEAYGITSDGAVLTVAVAMAMAVVFI